MTTGYARGPQCPLLRDREAMRLPASSTPGIRLYHNNIAGLAHSLTGGNSYFNFSTDSPANFTVETPLASGFAYATERTIKPIRYQTPLAECVFDNSYNIYMSEFTIEQSITPQLIWALIQHGWDGNTASALSIGKLRMKLRRAGAV